MANLTRLFHWERFVPNIGDNLRLPAREQLALEIATGLSVVEVETFGAAWAAASKASKGAHPARPGPKAKAEELKAYVEAAKAELERMRLAQAEHLAPLWEPFVRLAPGTHTINGKPLATLKDYLQLVLMQNGLFNFNELQRVVLEFNSLSGADALFSRALSGGSDSTGDLNSAPES